MSRSRLAMLAVLLLVASPASAVTGGQPDGDAHPNVGALVVDVPGVGPSAVCSGTLVAPAVFLTAAHCTAWLPSLGIERVWVTFDSTLDPAGWRLAPGAYRTDPAYGHDLADLHDLAVVLLEEPVVGIEPAALPRAGLLDRSRGQTVTNVGYGFHDRVTAGGPPQFLYDGARRASTSLVVALTSGWLRLLTSSKATGQGGVCFGDSGGPQFLAGTTTLVTVTSRGDAACSGIGWGYRLDTEPARRFLGRFVTLL